MSLRMLVAPVVGLAMSGAWASQAVEQTVAVTASVPEKVFEITAVDDWWNKPLILKQAPNRNGFEARQEKIVVRSNAGPVTLKFALRGFFQNSQGQPVQNFVFRAMTPSGMLGGEPIQIASAAEAAEGKVIELTMDAITTSRLKPDAYTAQMSFLFETAAP